MPGGDAGISLIAQAGIRAVASDVAVMSGYLSMSVPFLAAALAYGLSKATVLATSVLAVGQDAASAAAQEGTTGNISLAKRQLSQLGSWPPRLQYRLPQPPNTLATHLPYRLQLQRNFFDELQKLDPLTKREMIRRIGCYLMAIYLNEIAFGNLLA